MKPLMRIILVCTLISVGLFDLQAKEAGTLVLEGGIAKLRRNKMDRIIQAIGQELVVNEKDEIQTGGDTRVRLYLRQKNESILLYSNSFFVVEEVNEERSELSFPVGKVRCLVKPTFSKTNRTKRRFRLRTVTALVGVKGTDFVVETSGSATNVLTLEGSVNFSNVMMPDVIVEVAENQASTAVQQQAPSPPVEVPEEAREKITSEDTGERWEGVDPPEAEEPKAQKEEKKPKEQAQEEEEPKSAESEESAEEEPPSEAQPVVDAPKEEPVPETVVEEPPEIDIPIDTLPTIPDDPGDVKEEADNLGEAADQTVIITIQEQ